MNHFFKLGACAALLGVSAGLVHAAPDTASETRPLDAQIVRVKLEGVGDLTIRQGKVATLVLTGDARLLSRTTTSQRGDTLSIETEGRRGGFNFGRHAGIQAELVLPNLRAVSSESIGATTVSGFTGEALDINLDGAGSMSVSSSNYRFVTANLGGVGNLRINGIDAEGIDLNLGGAGFVTLNGRSKRLKAELGGLGGLDAQGCIVESVALDLSGLGNATVNVRQSVDVSLSGMGSVTVLGKPANRKVALDGLGKVNWK